MRVTRTNETGDVTIHLNADESERMKEMIKGASLPLRQVFHKILMEI